MLLVAGAVVLVFDAAGARVEPVVARELRLLGLGVAGAALALLISGSFATAAGPHSGGGTEHVARFARLEPVVYVHAAVVAVFGCSFLFLLGYLFARRERLRPLFLAALAVLVIVLGQVGLGELQYRLHLPWYLVLVHVGVAATAWAALVALVTGFWRPPPSLRRAAAP
jgi:heme A synthase